MFWHSKPNNTLQLSQHKLKEANKSYLTTFFLFWTLPAWLCGWRCINSSVCATNSEVSKHSWFGAVLQLLHSTTKYLSYKYPNNTHQSSEYLFRYIVSEFMKVKKIIIFPDVLFFNTCPNVLIVLKGVRPGG